LVKRNLYEFDDWLIRAGYLVGAWALIAPSCSGGAFPTSAFTSLWSLVAMACAVVVLVAGYAVRADERRIVRVWDILDHTREANVEELGASTGYSAEFLRRAVHVINRQPGSYYVFDDANGVIVDGRMRTRHHVIERCDSCGAKVSAQVSLDLPSMPACSHCGNPVSTRSMSELKLERMDELRRTTVQIGHKFRWWLFLLLFLLSGGLAAVIYALWTTGLFDRMLGRADA
jgi:hypothetical protein